MLVILDKAALHANGALKQEMLGISLEVIYLDKHIGISPN